jgi:hypothetical protein
MRTTNSDKKSARVGLSGAREAVGDGAEWEEEERGQDVLTRQH